jgi:hypothetical protein
MIRYAAALLLSLSLFSGAEAADRALLVGIGTYASLPEKMFLEGPKNDVPLIEKLLKEKQGYAADSIRILLDKDATRAAILASIDEWLINGTQPGDRVYLYFSGHGLQVKDVSGDEEDGLDEALSTFDIAAGNGDWTNVILDDEIDAMLEKLKDRAVSIVIDACHSGTISRSLSTKVGDVMESARFLPRPFAKPVEEVKISPSRTAWKPGVRRHPTRLPGTTRACRRKSAMASSRCPMSTATRLPLPTATATASSRTPSFWNM